MTDFTEKDIKTKATLTVEGFYWMADTSDSDADWFMAWVEGEPGEGNPGDEGYCEPDWIFSLRKNDFEEFDGLDDYVFLGPVTPPELAIPIAVPKAPLVFPKVALPSLTRISPTPALTPIKR